MTTKEQMRAVIDTAKDEDEFFLMEECCGVDLMVDAVNKSLDKMNKKDLTNLYAIALEVNKKRGV